MPAQNISMRAPIVAFFSGWGVSAGSHRAVQEKGRAGGGDREGQARGKRGTSGLIDSVRRLLWSQRPTIVVLHRQRLGLYPLQAADIDGDDMVALGIHAFAIGVANNIMSISQ